VPFDHIIQNQGGGKRQAILLRRPVLLCAQGILGSDGTVEQKPCKNYSLVKQLRQGQITEFFLFYS